MDVKDNKWSFSLKNKMQPPKLVDSFIEFWWKETFIPKKCFVSKMCFPNSSALNCNLRVSKWILLRIHLLRWKSPLISHMWLTLVWPRVCVMTKDLCEWLCHWVKVLFSEGYQSSLSFSVVRCAGMWTQLN